MIPLTQDQLAHIEQFLEEIGVTFEPFKEEMLDHIAIQIEQEVSNGQIFDQAAASAFESFQEDEIKEIQTQIFKSHNQKQLFMKRLSLAALFLLLISSLLWSSEMEPPSRSPLGEVHKITSHYGPRMHPVNHVKKLHTGVDYQIPIGTQVHATGDGVVLELQEEKKGYGNLIILQHDDEYQSYYASLSEFKVEVGQKISKGEVIGLSGNSGTSTGPHLHYEVRKNGVAENPEDYMRP